VNCNRCGGRGTLGGGLPGQKYEGPWRWCGCPASMELREREPNLIDEANVARLKLVRQMKPVKVLQGDGYQGEF